MLSLSPDPLLGWRESPHNSAVKGFFDVFEPLCWDLCSVTWECLGAPALWGWSVGSGWDMICKVCQDCVWSQSVCGTTKIVHLMYWRAHNTGMVGVFDCIKGYFADSCACDSEQILSKCLGLILLEEKKKKSKHFPFISPKEHFTIKKLLIFLNQLTLVFLMCLWAPD